MGFQTLIKDRQAFGNVGEFFDNSPSRVATYILNSLDPATNIFGNAFTLNGQEGDYGTVEAGGTGVFAGFLIGPKEHALLGTVAGSLEPSITLQNGLNAAFCNMGIIYVYLPAPATVGDLVVYLEADGSLETIAPAAALPVGTQFAHAVVERFDVVDQDPNNNQYLAVIRITDVPVTPTP